ncbi:MAG TPA: hypothetical protein VIJ28_12910 [Chloroflexota bacterium]
MSVQGEIRQRERDGLPEREQLPIRPGSDEPLLPQRDREVGLRTFVLGALPLGGAP